MESTFPRLQRMLLENIVPFWLERAIDREHGGFRLNHDASGAWRGPADKALVTQARCTWFFSHLARSRYAADEHRRAAAAGAAFLLERLWDEEHGGFFWSVDARGQGPVRSEKHLYGQAFGLYALSEFALLSGDEPSRQRAHELFELLETRARDDRRGGYAESFARNWQALPDGHMGCLGAPSGLKLMNTHLHLLEALAVYHALRPEDRVKARLRELIDILGRRVVRRRHGACIDRHTRRWRALWRRRDRRNSPGHDLENLWLLRRACLITDDDPAPILALGQRLFDHALRFGFDAAHGGFYESGRLSRFADARDKVWWVQAECLVAALMMHQLTQQPRYGQCYLRTLDWIEKHQADWTHGDWHARIRPDGSAEGAKADAWKGPYHNGRAMIECLRMIAGESDLAAAPAPATASQNPHRPE